MQRTRPRRVTRPQPPTKSVDRPTAPRAVERPWSPLRRRPVPRTRQRARPVGAMSLLRGARGTSRRAPADPTSTRCAAAHRAGRKRLDAPAVLLDALGRRPAGRSGPKVVPLDHGPVGKRGRHEGAVGKGAVAGETRAQRGVRDRHDRDVGGRPLVGEVPLEAPADVGKHERAFADAMEADLRVVRPCAPRRLAAAGRSPNRLRAAATGSRCRSA